MVADVLSVDPHGGLIVARADMQEGMPPRTLPVRRQGDGAAVPDAVAEVCVADAGQPAFPAEGYCDGFGKGGVVLEAASFAAFRTVCSVRPCAVEIDPRGADKLRARVFGARNGSLIHRKNSFRILVLCLGTAHEERFHYTGLPLLCQSFFGRYLRIFRGQGCACVRRGAFPPCRLPLLPLALPFAPIPRPPSPVGKGETKVIFMQGASPLASPGAEPAPRLQPLPIRCQAGGLPFLSPANPVFSLLSCPHPPYPLPGGKGENITLFRRGLRPRHPGIKPPAALTDLATQASRWRACLLCCPPILPLA